jgi:hypothetical protein
MNVKVRKRIGYPGQKPRRPSRTRPTTTSRAPARPASRSRAGAVRVAAAGCGARGVNVLVIGAGASGAVVAKDMAEAGFSVVCLEQGGWLNASDYPATGGVRAPRRAFVEPDPNVRERPRTIRARSRAPTSSR